MANQIYEKVAARITEAVNQQLAKGIIPWRMPWQAMGGAVNGISMKPYRGVNQLLLGCYECPSGIFLTYKQAKELGGQIKKGSKSIPIVFWKMYGQQRDEKGFITDKGVPMIKTSLVFPLDNFYDIPTDKLPKKPLLKLNLFDAHESSEQLIASIRPQPVVRLAGHASYSPSEDVLRMPDPFLFNSFQDYYHTYFHELGHWTGHATRLDRFGAKKKSYAFEELVAELCAAFLCVHARLDPVDNKDDLEQRASYIAGWMTQLKENPKLLLEATGQAQKAADYILGKVAQDTEIVTFKEQLPLAA